MEIEKLPRRPCIGMRESKCVFVKIWVVTAGAREREGRRKLEGTKDARNWGGGKNMRVKWRKGQFKRRVWTIPDILPPGIAGNYDQKPLTNYQRLNKWEKLEANE